MSIISNLIAEIKLRRAYRRYVKAIKTKMNNEYKHFL